MALIASIMDSPPFHGPQAIACDQFAVIPSGAARRAA
jgi:hypothetical protein